MSLTPWNVEGTNAYIERIRKENPNKFIMKIHINSAYGSEQTYTIYLYKLYYDLAIINEMTMDKVLDIFKDDFISYGTFQSKQKAPYKKNAYRPSEGKLYKYCVNPITKEQLPQIVKTMKEKAKEEGIDLLFTVNEIKLEEYK